MQESLELGTMIGVDLPFVYAAGAATTTAASRETESITLENMAIYLMQNVGVDKRMIACGKDG